MPWRGEVGGDRGEVGHRLGGLFLREAVSACEGGGIMAESWLLMLAGRVLLLLLLLLLLLSLLAKEEAKGEVVPLL